MTKPFAVLEMIQGPEGPCVSLGNRRIAGPKPWGGGTCIKRWPLDRRQVETIRDECEGLLRTPLPDEAEAEK